jgi:hypothetical protein
MVEMLLLELSLRLSLYVEGATETELQTHMLKSILENIDVFDFLRLVPSDIAD